MRNNSNMTLGKRRFISTLFDVFGYSLVGILAYCFGLVLQNYNTNGELIRIFLNYSTETKQILLIILVHSLLIFMFGHVYAMVILLGKTDEEIEKKIDVCSVIGHWLETICVCVIIFLIMLQIFFVQVLTINFWQTVLASMGIYISSFISYRRLKKKEYENLKYTSRYVLVCPAMIMIGYNIYAGANICSMLNGDRISFLIAFVLWIIILWLYFCKNKSIGLISTFIMIGITFVGVLSLNTKLNPNVVLTLKNCFLACMVTFFLSVFESWYVMFRQLKNCSDEQYVKVSMVIVALMPSVVVLLYPIQNFNFIYFVFFWIGMLLTDFISFFVIYPIMNVQSEVENKKRRKIAIIRAIFGILTLIFLMLDKYFVYNPVWHEKGIFLLSDDIIGILSFLLSIIGLFLGTGSSNQREKGESLIKWIEYRFVYLWKNILLVRYMLIRLISFLVVTCISSYIYGFMNSNETKAKLSSLAMFLYVFWTIVVLVKTVRSEGKNENS